MTLLEQYMDCMQKGDCVALADLFTDHGDPRLLHY